MKNEIFQHIFTSTTQTFYFNLPQRANLCDPCTANDLLRIDALNNTGTAIRGHPYITSHNKWGEGVDKV